MFQIWQILEFLLATVHCIWCTIIVQNNNLHILVQEAYKENVKKTYYSFLIWIFLRKNAKKKIIFNPNLCLFLKGTQEAPNFGITRRNIKIHSQQTREKAEMGRNAISPHFHLWSFPIFVVVDVSLNWTKHYDIPGTRVGPGS